MRPPPSITRTERPSGDHRFSNGHMTDTFAHALKLTTISSLMYVPVPPITTFTLLMMSWRHVLACGATYLLYSSPPSPPPSLRRERPCIHNRRTRRRCTLPRYHRSPPTVVSTSDTSIHHREAPFRLQKDESIPLWWRGPTSLHPMMCLGDVRQIAHSRLKQQSFFILAVSFLLLLYLEGRLRGRAGCSELRIPLPTFSAK